ncbi:uncharacterized protein LOC141893102 isoform X3 [Acropora palmata]|uniref:uncharacterized protein LOC141893102 isoform X3 n=1 Tax=Acropora palmata TaxID=6131 RepID=UPI003DA08C8A
MAASLDEKIAEAVRRFPVLYDKSCKDFKDNNTKKNAWEDVAKIAGLSSGEEPKTYFTNLRTRYTRDRKKLKKVKVSGTGSEDVSKVKDEEMRGQRMMIPKM